MGQGKYPVQPPSYTPALKNYQSTNNSRGSRDSTRSSSLSSNTQQNTSGLPEDFKYGVTVSRCSLEIRNAFVRKVYTILIFQIMTSATIAGLISYHPDLHIVVEWIQSHRWAFYLLLFASLVNFGILQWKRQSHPWNFLFLATFTVFEACSIGAAVSLYDKILIFQALLMTSGVFFMLTLFTLYSKHDFSGMGPFLFAPLMALGMAGIVSIFFPFNHTMDLIYAVFGCFVFSSYTIFDTHMIHQRVSPDEYISAVLSLYVDFIGFFFTIFRFFNCLKPRGSGNSH